MDYAAIYLDANIHYHASDMILHVATDAASHVLPVAGHYLLSNHPPTHSTLKPVANSPIHTVCQTIVNVVSSVARTECRGLFINGQQIIPQCNTLIAMDHPQPSNGAPLKIDSVMALGIVKNYKKPRRSKSLEMCHHWIKDRDKLGDLNQYWEKGIHNWADYFIKHHLPAYHRIM